MILLTFKFLVLFKFISVLGSHLHWYQQTQCYLNLYLYLQIIIYIGKFPSALTMVWLKLFNKLINNYSQSIMAQQLKAKLGVLYILENDNNCQRAMQLAVNIPEIHIQPVRLLGADQVPKWLDQVPTLVTLSDRKIHSGSNAFDVLSRILEARNAQKAASLQPTMQQYPPRVNIPPSMMTMQQQMQQQQNQHQQNQQSYQQNPKQNQGNVAPSYEYMTNPPSQFQPPPMQQPPESARMRQAQQNGYPPQQNGGLAQQNGYQRGGPQNMTHSPPGFGTNTQYQQPQDETPPPGQDLSDPLVKGSLQPAAGTGQFGCALDSAFNGCMDIEQNTASQNAPSRTGGKVDQGDIESYMRMRENTGKIKGAQSAAMVQHQLQM